MRPLVRPFVQSLVLGASFFVSSAMAETLGEIYQQALENDHQFRAAMATYEAGKLEKTIGRAGLLPQITGGASWSRNEDRIADPSAEATTTGWNVTLSQPLFDLAAWHNYRRGDFTTQVAAANFHNEKQTLIVRTAEAYFNVLAALDLFQSAKAEENATASQLEQTRKRFEVGLTAITEVHEAQAAYDGALARRLLSEGQVGIAFESLEVLTGQPYNAIVPLKDDFNIVPPSPVDRQSWEKFAVENNFTLLAANLNARIAEQASKIARAGHAPTVSASVVYSDGSTDSDAINGLTNEPFGKTDAETLQTNVTLTVPLFASGRISASRRKALNEYYSTQETAQKTERDIKQSARSLHLSVLTDVATVKARKQAITSSRSALEATQAGYEVGTRDLVDVLNAQRALYTAQSNYSEALYTYVLNTLRLKAVAGLLNDDDIAALDAALDRGKSANRLQ